MQSIPNLIAIYYKNIGPFYERECSLLFEEGKYLIKANIGSGKSFLFFDGPTYALYGSSGDKKTTGSKGRDILNKKCTEGKIALLFEVDGMYYLIKRQLSRKKTKAGSSTTLFTVQYQGKNLEQDIKKRIQKSEPLMWDYNIIEEIESFTDLLTFEKKDFKNETDLQTLLTNEVLLDKSVFLNTIFLLQDSKNIFECEPQERIMILKNVFGLMGIDEQKEKVAEEKREIDSKIRFLGNFEKINEKLSTNFKALFQFYQRLQRTPTLMDKLGNSKDFFSTYELLGNEISFEKLNIENFSLSGLDKKIFEHAKEDIEKENEKYKKLLTEKRMLIEQKEQTEKEILMNKSEQRRYQIKIDENKKQITEFDEHALEKIKQEKNQISSSLSEKDQGIDYTILNQVLKENSFEIPFEKDEIHDIDTAGEYIEQCINKGKFLKEEGKHYQELIEQLSHQEKQRNEQKDNNLKNLKEKFELLKNIVETEQKKVDECTQKIENETIFACDKIQGNCPYINLINKQNVEARKKEKEEQQRTLEEKIQQLKEFKFEQRYEEELKREPETNFTEKKKELEGKIEKTNTLCNKMRIFLQRIDYTIIQKRKEEKKQLLAELQQKDKIFSDLFEKKQNQERFQKEITERETTIKHYGEQEKSLNDKITSIGGQIEELQRKISKYEEQTLGDIHIILEQFLKYYEEIEKLLNEFAQTKQDILQLEQKQIKIKNLYNILNSELVIYSFQNFLPDLSERINDLLHDIVEFEISMKPEQKANGDLELQILFKDDKGEREVSSLSGGQKTVLKLVRMLTISSYLQTPLLFLDETINNLDGETVSHVAELINNFVKERTIKFYTITHNSEIQAMNVWDKTIEF